MSTNVSLPRPAAAGKKIAALDVSDPGYMQLLERHIRDWNRAAPERVACGRAAFENNMDALIGDHACNQD